MKKTSEIILATKLLWISYWLGFWTILLLLIFDFLGSAQEKSLLSISGLILIAAGWFFFSYLIFEWFIGLFSVGVNLIRYFFLLLIWFGLFHLFPNLKDSIRESILSGLVFIINLIISFFVIKLDFTKPGSEWFRKKKTRVSP